MLDTHKPRMSRDDAVWHAEVIILALIDRIETGLPDAIVWQDRLDQSRMTTLQPSDLTDYENGALDMAGSALCLLYTQMTDDGITLNDALEFADKLDEAIKNFMGKAWENGGAAFKQKYAELIKKDGGFHAPTELYADFGYPDPAKHAEAFVKNTFDKMPDVLTDTN